MAKFVDSRCTCEYSVDGLTCDNRQSDIVYSRKEKKVLVVCDYHSGLISDHNHSEYNHRCENCGCNNPVN